MSGRRKPISTRQKKAEQKLKRAVKRGDIPPPEPKAKSRPRPGRLRGQAARLRVAQVDSVRRLQSAFIKLPPNFLEESKLVASTVPLIRPIPDSAAIYGIKYVLDDFPRLTCPRRPKWRFDMSKLEVERNEEGLCKKWLEQTDGHLGQWQESESVRGEGSQPASPGSPSYFERNLEVWRQLWRVSEISQILLVLLDSRCPLIHYPPSLDGYLVKRKVIFVLTKVDITGPACVKAWVDYLHIQFPGTRIVQVESYMEKNNTADQGRPRLEPHIPANFRNSLVDAIREAHAELLEPPSEVQSDPSRLATWKPPVKRDIDWTLVKDEPDRDEKPSGAHSPPHDLEQVIDDSEPGEMEYLTVGLIGQPNVGKSSLLNALFGQQKVKASKTPGKTKHFQTLFWTREVRFVDCPGLVMPNYIPMELQVLCGILPISRISAVPACIHFVASLLPLERILNLGHPNELIEPAEDKRTWREGMTRAEGSSRTRAWTAMDILIAYANSRGWVTAKAARPDIHRAGNSILRHLAEGKIGWAFWPPDADEKSIVEENEDGNGVWIPRYSAFDEKTDRDGSEQEQHDDSEGDENVTSSDASDSGNEERPLQSMASRFDALAVDEDESEQDEATD